MSRHGGLNSTKVEGHIRDLLDNLPLLVALVESNASTGGTQVQRTYKRGVSSKAPALK